MKQIKKYCHKDINIFLFIIVYHIIKILYMKNFYYILILLYSFT